jgi:hypothetical protein
MLAANRDGHPSDPNRERIAPKRPEVKRLDRDALVKAKVAQAAGLSFAKRRPINRSDVRPRSEREIVEEGGRHCD